MTLTIQPELSLLLPTFVHCACQRHTYWRVGGSSEGHKGKMKIVLELNEEEVCLLVNITSRISPGPHNVHNKRKEVAKTALIHGLEVLAGSIPAPLPTGWLRSFDSVKWRGNRRSTPAAKTWRNRENPQATP